MKKEEKHIMDIYMGGEKDPEKIILPKRYGHFFNKKWLLITLAILTTMILIAGVGL
ncbi:MAG: hypothetical protein ACE5J4_00050 [Candidatus Aenigmatarchaeota archaeon]